MKKNLLLLLTAAIMLAFNGCALKKMVKNANLVTYNVTPNPIEYKAGKVPVGITINFPAKYFAKKAYLVATPVVTTKDGNKELPLKSFTLQGEGIKDNNPAIPYETGGSYNFNDTIAYDSTFRNSDLIIKVGVNKGGAGKTLSFASVKLAIGIITTPLLVDEGLIIDNGTVGNTGKGMMSVIVPTISLPQPQPEKQSLVLYYPLQQSKLDSKEQKKVDIDTFVKELSSIMTNPDMKFNGINVAAYASPDGPQNLNSGLVKGRGDNSTDFLKNKFKSNKVNAQDFMTRQTTPDEDWEGFKNAVSQSNMQDKELILRVLSMYSDPDVREKEIKKMSKVYDELRKDILPKLRRAEIVATYQTRQKTADELVSLGKTDPNRLSQDELFFAGQTATGMDKEMIYKKYNEKYPQDWRGFNNLGVYYIQNNQLTEAEIQLQKAENIDANNATIINNLGALYYAKEDYKKAKEYFQKAAGINPSDNINYNLGVLCIKEGKYAEAVQKFGATASYNKSLAQVMNGQTKESISTINNVNSQEAFYFYLKAVEYARDNDKTQCINNLRQAISKNANLKEYAKDDIEYRALFNDEDFKSVVQ